MTPNLPRAANDSRGAAPPPPPEPELARIFRTHRVTAVPFREWLEPESLRTAASFNAGDYLRARAVPQVTVTWPARLLVWAVMLAVVGYCAAIWATGGAL
jgi:hypothetical protein